MKHIRVRVRSSQSEEIALVVSPAKARAMIERGEAMVVSRRREPLELRLLSLVRPVQVSPAALTAKEVERAVDGSGRDRRKIEAWPHIGTPSWRWLGGE